MVVSGGRGRAARPDQARRPKVKKRAFFGEVIINKIRQDPQGPTAGSWCNHGAGWFGLGAAAARWRPLGCRRVAVPSSGEACQGQALHARPPRAVVWWCASRSRAGRVWRAWATLERLTTPSLGGSSEPDPGRVACLSIITRHWPPTSKRWYRAAPSRAVRVVVDRSRRCSGDRVASSCTGLCRRLWTSAGRLVRSYCGEACCRRRTANGAAAGACRPPTAVGGARTRIVRKDDVWVAEPADNRGRWTRTPAWALGPGGFTNRALTAAGTPTGPPTATYRRPVRR